MTITLYTDYRKPFHKLKEKCPNLFIKLFVIQNGNIKFIN